MERKNKKVQNVQDTHKKKKQHVIRVVLLHAWHLQNTLQTCDQLN